MGRGTRKCARSPVESRGLAMADRPFRAHSVEGINPGSILGYAFLALRAVGRAFRPLGNYAICGAGIAADGLLKNKKTN